MSIRDIFRLAMKLFGLYQAMYFLFSGGVGALISGLSASSFSLAMMSLLGSGIVIGVFILLIFFSDKLIDLLRLDKGFDSSRIEVSNIDVTRVLRVAVILIGAYFLIEGVIGTIYTFWSFFSSNVIPVELTLDVVWSFPIVELIMSSILLTRPIQVVNLLNRLSRKRE